MKNSLIITPIYLILLFLATSCTEKPVIIPDFVAPESDRVVLLEELTGVRCPNCPSGAAKVEDLLHLYEGQLVVMAVHGDFDTEPLAESRFDFRTDESRALEDYLKPFYGKPSAAINRVINEDGEQSIIGVDTWSGYIEDELAKQHQLDLQLTTDYNEATREVKINVGLLPLTDLTGNYNLSVAITESHIIDAQLNQTTVIPDYEHMHVFRKMLTDIKGDLLASGTLEKNEVINRSFSYVLPTHESVWLAENCSVIAFVTEIEGNSKEVLQAVEAKVVN